VIEGSCHCGAVKFKITISPEWLIDCNCSICSRIGAYWGLVNIKNVLITAPKDGTISYVHGEKTIAHHSCKVCGCTTHWENLKPADSNTMGVNFKMCQAKDIADYKIRKFDGAKSWIYLD